jgi:dimethylhistidine N-methyltransferase
MRTPRFIQTAAADTPDERESLRSGLLAAASSIAPKYFYDRLGSHLFEAITELDEYYPTRTERSILDSCAGALAQAAGTGTTLIDLGAGNCAKATRLFPLLEPQRYVAVDISVDFLREALRQVQREHPQTEVVGLELDFSRSLALPADLLQGRPLCFYPGSSIGNFAPDEALAFLRRIREHAQGGGLAIGVDLVKPAPILEAAYDDALGVTAAFNLNVLRHLNRLIESDFEPRDWRHVARFDAGHSRIEMHLEARRDLEVHWPGAVRPFAAGERIHTENSYKYTPAAFEALLREAGFGAPTRWSDPRGWFAVWWAPAG